jgi:DNA polymerase-4
LSLVASVGVAPNKFLAKIASDLEKPDGLVVVDPGRVQEFLEPLPVGRLWGVGRVTGGVFDRLGIRTIGQLRQMPVELLRQHFGNSGNHLWELAHGIDERRVIPEHQAKSISHEKTFSHDLEDSDALRAWLLELSEQVACRLRRHRLAGRTIHLKVRFDDFRTVTRAKTLAAPTDVTQEIWHTVSDLLAERMPERRLRVRLLGVGVSGFDHARQVQLTLFSDQDHERQSRLDAVADDIRKKFGSSSLQRALGLMHDVTPKSGADGPNPDQYGE